MPATVIHRLPPVLANKIAAGEVVERPASVVKELVENALDAGASRLTVTLQAGGRRLIKVVDDGIGMSPEDAELCVERHATSKIQSDADLEAIGTFGFRGEALSSIASVSKFELITRQAEAVAGTRVSIDGGVDLEVNEIGAPPGTSVTVQQLFFNIPARAKFLKSRETELSHCLTVVQQAAVAHPGLAVKLEHNGKALLDLPPAEDRLIRVGQIWGTDVTRTLRPVEATGPGYRLTGYIAGPELTRSNRSLQLTFINGRPITNPTVSHAIGEGYRGRLMVGRQPVTFLFFHMEPDLVDVNVHPTKREVRFRRSDPIHQGVANAIREAFGDTVNAGHPVPRRVATAPYITEGRTPNVPPPSQQHWDMPATTTPGSIAPPTPAGLEPTPIPETAWHQRQPLGPTVPLQAEFEDAIPPYTFLQQIFGTYLLCVYEDQLVIIDQHALHERMVYETLMQRVQDTEWKTQRLLLPRVLQCSPDQAAILGEHLEVFQRVGIEIEPFGENTFAIASVSQLHSEEYVEAIVRDGIEELRQGLSLKAPAELLDRLLRMSACKNAIKSGHSLTPADAEALIDGLRALPSPPTCLHGRPLVLAISQHELDRRFGRLGTVH